MTPTQAAGIPVPLGAESDIYCSGYIGDMDEQFPFSILGSEYDSQVFDSSNYDIRHGKQIQGRYGAPTTVKFGLASGDIIYVDGGKAKGLSPGSLFTVVVADQPVFHPLRREPPHRHAPRRPRRAGGALGPQALLRRQDPRVAVPHPHRGPSRSKVSPPPVASSPEWLC